MKLLFTVSLTLLISGIGQSALGALPLPCWHTSQTRSSAYSLYVERGMNENGYIVKIHIRGLEPTAIQIMPRPGHLLIRSSNQNYTSRRGNAGQRGFSVFSSNFLQRVPLPRDADLSRMQRTDAPDVITIAIPRREAGRGPRLLW